MQPPFRVALVAAILGLAVTGCSGGQPRTAGSASAVPLPASAAPTPSANPSSPSPTRGLAMGATAAVANELDVTVYAYRPHSAPDAPPPVTAGYTWASVDVQTCIRPTVTAQITLMWFPWTLVFEDGAIVEASNTTYNQFVQPQYPNDPERLVPAGRCARGWITFAVPEGKTPKLVEYQPKGSLINWVVS